MSKARLAGAERDFLRLVSSAAFSNPFSDERKAFDTEIGGAAGAMSGLLCAAASGRAATRVAGRNGA